MEVGWIKTQDETVVRYYWLSIIDSCFVGAKQNTKVLRKYAEGTG